MPHRVAILAYDQLCTFEFGCAVELFALERPELEVDWYEAAVCAAEPGPLRAMGGVQVRARHGLAWLRTADTIAASRQPGTTKIGRASCRERVL